MPAAMPARAIWVARTRTWEPERSLPCGYRRSFRHNIAIADKNPMVLSALEALLTRDRRFNLLLMASDGVHFLNSWPICR